MGLQGKELPPAIWSKKVESHLTWIQCHIPFVEKTASEGLTRMEDYVLGLIAVENQTQRTEAVVAKQGRRVGVDAVPNPSHEVGEEESDETETTHAWASNIGHFALKLNIAAMHAYVSDFETAEVNLAEAWKLLKDLEESHQNVGLYCLEALKYSIDIMKNGPEVDESGFLAAIKNLRFDDKTTTAIITFLKGCLAVALNVPDEEVLLMFETAAELDPGCYLWHHYAFRKLRRIRRLQRVRDELHGPSDKERTYCENAFLLRPEDDFITIVDSALLLKEGLWGQRKEVWEDRLLDVLLCVDRFNNALKRATDKKNEWWIRKIKVYLAEFLVFGRSQCLDQLEGKRLLDECMKDYPSSSMVFHKSGKFYSMGLNGSKMFQDLEKAKNCLEKGLECTPWNFPCLMDYLRLLKILGKNDEVIRTIEKYLNCMKRDYQVAKLHILRGCFIWQYDPLGYSEYKKEASNSWLLVLEKYPSFDNELYAKLNIMHSRDLLDNTKLHIPRDRDRIVEHLESRQSEFAGDQIRSGLLQAIISAVKIEKIDDGLDWSSIRGPRDTDTEEDLSDLEGRIRSFSISSSESNSSFYSVYSQPQRSERRRPAPKVDYNGNRTGYQKPDADGFYPPPPPSSKKRRQQTYTSVADEDGDWRRKN